MLFENCLEREVNDQGLYRHNLDFSICFDVSISRTQSKGKGEQLLGYFQLLGGVGVVIY